MTPTRHLPIIALMAYKGTGKSTFAKRIVEEVDTGHHFHRMAIADPLKDGLKALAGRPKWDLSDPEVKAGRLYPSENPEATVRKALEGIGATIRALDPDYWVRRHHERLEALDGATRFDHQAAVIIDDLNFENEYLYLQQRGALILYLWREEVWSKRPWAVGPNGAVSLLSDREVRRMAAEGVPDSVWLDSHLHVDKSLDAIRQYLRGFQ